MVLRDKPDTKDDPLPIAKEKELQVVEVVVDLELLNKKLNYIIALLESSKGNPSL